jgi:integrase
MRAGDLIQLRQSNIHNGRLQYAMGKTDRIRDIKLLPEAIEILNHYMNLDQPTTDYIFPLLDNRARYAVAVTSEDRMKLQPEVKKRLLQQVNSKNSLINKYLGKIAEMAGINKKLTFHIARHSFANIARQKKANVFDISKTLGHSSIKITEAYLSNFDTISQDETMEKVFQPDSIGG